MRELERDPSAGLSAIAVAVRAIGEVAVASVESCDEREPKIATAGAR